MQYGISIDEMRYELEQFTKVTIDIPDAHVEALYMAWQGAVDTERPNWSRREMELFFEYIADGNGDNILKFQELRAQIDRHAEFDGDLVGRFDDSDYAEAG